MRPDWEKYAADICDEITQWGARTGHADVPTIFFGGGTPSLMPVGIFEKIMQCVAQNFHIARDAEITIEANPGTIDAARLADFRGAGLNRLSVGVQALDAAALTFLGRRHDVATARALLDAGMNMGLRVSADFIYGLPGQTAADVARMCTQINDIGLQHCSMYELTVEDGTPLAQSGPDMPSNTEMARMYMTIDDTLHIPRYEVSNYATPGQECRHNANVWDGAPYIGIGRAAAGRVRINNQWYEQRGGNELFVPISDAVRATEKIITGLRTTRGVLMDANVRSQLDMEWIAAHPELIQTDGTRIRATKSGLLTLDSILLELTR